MKSTQLNLPQTFTVNPVKIFPADTNSLKTIAVGGADDSAIVMISVSSTDTVARVLQFFLTIASVDYLIGSVNIPANAGNTSAALPINAMSSSFFPWQIQGSIPLNSAVTLRARCTTTVTASAEINIVAFGQNY